MFATINNGIVDLGGSFGAGLQYTRMPYRDVGVQLDVQRGLHCLTGADWDAETNKRRCLSLSLPVDKDCLEFGLALHALGDSFAHRDHDTHRMYPTGVGHGLETL